MRITIFRSHIKIEAERDIDLLSKRSLRWAGEKGTPDMKLS